MSKISRRALLGSVGTRPTAAKRLPRSRDARLRWLGAAAWEIQVADKTILLDPWLTRFGAGEATDPNTRLSVDPSKIDPYIQRTFAPSTGNFIERELSGLEPTRKAIAAASPRTKFVQLDHLQTFRP